MRLPPRRPRRLDPNGFARLRNIADGIREVPPRVERQLGREIPATPPAGAEMAAAQVVFRGYSDL